MKHLIRGGHTRLRSPRRPAGFRGDRGAADRNLVADMQKLATIGIRARDAAVHLSTHPEKVSGEPRVAWQAGVEATSGRQSRLTKIHGYVFAQPQPCGPGFGGNSFQV
jgi:hypothetical protein